MPHLLTRGRVSEKRQVLKLPTLSLRFNLILIFVWCLFAPGVAFGFQDCGSPILLDLDDGGITTSPLLGSQVLFDIDSDGFPEITGWSWPASKDGFLWLDINENGRVDDAAELFGDRTLLPSGKRAKNGFEALAIYDLPEKGGDGDGEITAADFIWRYLAVWIDEDHDGRSQESEFRHLDDLQIVALGLDYDRTPSLDDAGNLHLFTGYFVREVRHRFDVRPPGSPPLLRVQAAHDVYFAYQKIR